MIDEISIDGFGPYTVERPSTPADLGQMIYEVASEKDYAIYPVGGRTKLGYGCPPLKDGVALDLTGLDQVIDFPARDMTITVQAGMTVARLAEIAAKEKLRLPIDVPKADRATIGGILATNVAGSRRLGFGTLRDYLLGFSAYNDEGKEFKAGGRVVKNVAGYDMCKLFVGSWGTLGVLTQATFKLRPLPDETALIAVPLEEEEIEAKLQQLNSSVTRPVVIDLLNPAAGKLIFRKAGVPFPDGAWALVVGFEGNSEAVLWQMQTYIDEVDDDREIEARVGPGAESLWNATVEFPDLQEACITLKAMLRPSQVAKFCQAVQHSEHKPILRANAGNGIVVGHFTDELTKHQLTTTLAFWREAAGRSDGRVVTVKASHEYRNSLIVWGPPSPHSWLLRDIKQKFDPQGLFNPGRFVDGL